nr:MAG TPA: hypothetical protein [Caudoviricetes sp.]
MFRPMVSGARAISRWMLALKSSSRISSHRV